MPRSIVMLVLALGTLSCGELLEPLILGGASSTSGSTTSATSSSTGVVLDGTTTAPAASSSGGAGGSTTTGLDTSSSGTSSSSTGANHRLIDRGVVVRYFIDQNPDFDPITVLDAIDPPLDLQLQQTANGPFFVADGINIGLQWNGAGLGGSALSLANPKLISALDGSSTLTIELVASLDDASARTGAGDPVRFLELHDSFAFGASSTVGFVFTMTMGGGTLITSWNYPDVESIGRAVYHVVIDTGLAPLDHRIALFIDGQPQGAPGPGSPALDAMFVVDDSKELVLGNSADFNLSFGGTLYYAALYDTALDEAEVLGQAERLATDDDARP